MAAGSPTGGPHGASGHLRQGGAEATVEAVVIQRCCHQRSDARTSLYSFASQLLCHPQGNFSKHWSVPDDSPSSQAADFNVRRLQQRRNGNYTARYLHGVHHLVREVWRLSHITLGTRVSRILCLHSRFDAHFHGLTWCGA